MAASEASAKLSQSVRLSHFKQRTATPLLVALQLFHPMLITRYAAHWLWIEPARAALYGATVAALFAALPGMFVLLAGILALLALLTLCFSLVSEKAAPLIIEPIRAADANADFLADFVASHRDELRTVTDELGAVLFRGFDLHACGDGEPGMNNVEGFERVLAAANMKPTDFFGQAPRFQEPGWKFVFRNVAFEAPPEQPGLYTSFKKACGVVWSSFPAFLNFHNEMAYLDPAHHLGRYGVFACTQPSAIGGYTLFADARRVHDRLRKALASFPRAMKWVLARKKKQAVPKRAKCGYLEYLLGHVELESVPDQFWPTRQVKEMETFCKKLNLDLVEEPAEEGGDYVIWSKWIEPSRAVPGKTGKSGSKATSTQKTWWCNSNHVVVGSQGDGDLPKKMKWLFRFDDGTERGATWSEIYSIALAYWRETTFFTWHAGDLIIFNNQIITHDATPGSGKRQILPTFGDCF